MTPGESDAAAGPRAERTREGSVPVPRTEAGRAALAALLGDPSRVLLALDFDGVLSPIVEDPDDAHVHPGAATVLGRLAAHLALVAIVTGRPADQAVRLGGFAGADGLGELVVLGQYGVERWEAQSGRTTAPPPPAGIAAARERVPGLLADLGLADAQVEDKSRALGLHVRRVADPDAALERMRAPVAALAEELDLHVEPGRHVLELRTPGSDKGGAIDALVAETGARTVVYAGDDLGDVPAYDAVQRHRDGAGHGLLIWSESHESPAAARALEPRADLVLAGPDGVIGWLGTLAAQLEATA